MDAKVTEYFLEKDYNCAEATLHILNDRYNLGLREQDYMLLSGFGAGCGYGLICGALAGCMGAMGKLLVTERAHVTPDFKETCGRFCECFEERLGGTACAELRPRYFSGEIRCARLLDAATAAFDVYLQNSEIQSKEST